MTTKPATPLPWTVPIGPIAEIVHDAPNEKALVIADCIGTECVRKQNAAYIVHACNAYPLMIERIKIVLGEQSTDQHTRDVLGALLRSLREDK